MKPKYKLDIAIKKVDSNTYSAKTILLELVNNEFTGDQSYVEASNEIQEKYLNKFRRECSKMFKEHLNNMTEEERKELLEGLEVQEGKEPE